ncbi:TNF receptor-associated factor 4-like [Oopsacas minuta]|uniref:TNF receptor-associated factor 4-like n=1 Tax=Oopsacas minuta TaxID=111878 RepID=A0AAV7JT19_9METZ|nr:TNF receptor-associated factor 4-like [Oopsacas minuta]
MATCKVIDSKEKLALTPVVGILNTYGGYKRELITKTLSFMEQTLLICSKCSGIMREACNIGGGGAMVCEACVGVGEGALPVGAVRTMISILTCRCPLKFRGCRWEGTVAEIPQHLDECDRLIVQCPYSMYGCGKNEKRGEMERHKVDGREYHNELMSIFMLNRIELLETDREQQAIAIQNLQDRINIMSEEREFMKFNGIVWKIKNREMIKMKLLQLEASPNKSSSRVLNSQFNLLDRNTFIGPKFELDSYTLIPQLVLIDSKTISLNLNSTEKEKDSILMDLKVICKAILLNGHNTSKNWVRKSNTFQFGGSISVLDIPSSVLLGQDYNNSGIIVLKLLFKIDYT